MSRFQEQQQGVARRDGADAGVVNEAMKEVSSKLWQRERQFTLVLPSHINTKTWLATTLAALRRDEKGRLALAAREYWDDFMVALFRAAQMGLEPGTEQYYLTIRKGRIAGVPGYQGEIEMIYRAGAVSSVVAQIVHENDRFSWNPRVGGAPDHEASWFGDRGPMVGVYAYAVMKDGAVSNPVILNRSDIQKIRTVSDAADSGYSPWSKWEESMWLKSAAHRLRKWVPTSSEYVGGQTRAVAGAEADVRGRAAIPTQYLAAAEEFDPDLAVDQRALAPSTPPQGVQQAQRRPQVSQQRQAPPQALEQGEYDPTVEPGWAGVDK